MSSKSDRFWLVVFVVLVFAVVIFIAIMAAIEANAAGDYGVILPGRGNDPDSGKTSISPMSNRSSVMYRSSGPSGGKPGGLPGSFLTGGNSQGVSYSLPGKIYGRDTAWTPKRFDMGSKGGSMLKRGIQTSKPGGLPGSFLTGQPGGFLTAAGHSIGVSRETMSPLQIIDTAVFSDGVAEIILSTTPRFGAKRTAPTNTSRIIPIMAFPDSGVYLSHHYFSGDMRKLTLVASDNTFDGRVEVNMRVR